MKVSEVDCQRKEILRKVFEEDDFDDDYYDDEDENEGFMMSM